MAARSSHGPEGGARFLQPAGQIVVTRGINEDDEVCVRDMERWELPHPPEAEASKMVDDAALSLASITYLDGMTPSEKLAEVLR